MTAQQHPLADYPEDERIDYLSLIAVIAATDGQLDDAEITQLRNFCATIGIGEIGIGMVIAALENAAAVALPPLLTRLAQTALKYTLLTDLFCMAYADGIVSPAETAEIKKIAALLAVSPAQLAALTQYVDIIQTARQTPPTACDWQERGREIGAALAAVNVPVEAVVLSGALCCRAEEHVTPAIAALSRGLGATLETQVGFTGGLRGFWGIRWLVQKL